MFYGKPFTVLGVSWNCFPSKQAGYRENVFKIQHSLRKVLLGKGYLAANGFHLFCRKKFSQRKGKLGDWICKVNWGIIFWWNKQLESPEIWVPHICSGLCPLVPFPMLSIILAYGMIFDEFNSRCFHLFKQKYLCFLDSKEIMAVNLGYRVMPYTEEKLFSILEMKEWK